ncbi:hypothetical protein O6H91_15G072700 [Diphasiastrum complanatum]|uniref:Uncharacterized protein n=1 Tax=Diphasiastrum complanatum TaxID=34168 RepID=A0ACC2BKM7_DIPCM|nr:hypothetical protein O6H91_15G072700 [Diphasiastrum complanatum]
MLIEGIQPDERTLTIVLNACSNPSVLAKGKQIHALIADFRLESHVILGTALVKMYSICGSVHAAKCIRQAPCSGFNLVDSMIAAWMLFRKCPCQHVCKMRKSGGCMESFRDNASARCYAMEYDGGSLCTMWLQKNGFKTF